MRRVVAILKYVPAVLCGLLLLAWVTGLIQKVTVIRDGAGVIIANGSLGIYFQDDALLKMAAGGLEIYFGNDTPLNDHVAISLAADSWSYKYAGRLEARDETHYSWVRGHLYSVPLPLLLSLASPAVLAPFTRFRFPLWSYFAWTALIAAELAFYLRA